MDDIALNFSDLTTPDRADRARKAFEVYADEFKGSKIEDLIADLLHLADVDDVPGGGPRAAERAVSHYAAERPTWPEQTWPYVAQSRPCDGAWQTVSGGEQPYAAAATLRNDMERAGLRYSELADHCEDLARGQVLTAEDGTEFRVIPGGGE